MTEERWRHMERVYQAALELREDQRAAFLEESCRGAPDLRRAVEALLAAKPLSLLEHPALDTMETHTTPLHVREGEAIGNYRIENLLGRGGMGEVYRAHDAKLNRDVAIKVLPSAFAGDPERLSRFRREARTLASLNHPNIAAIFGLEDSGQTTALVMELVEGPTLADRIRHGPIPIEESLTIARQIADALEYAHESGIIHRDLKPANLKVARNDTVKILDFGLAKALDRDSESPGAPSSPTITQATEPGVLLGTAAYMSPEQAKAKPADRRADIWAFGCVLFEMLTGKRAFRGEAMTDTLAAVIHTEPDWSLLPAATPRHVRSLLQRCLQKDARQRLQAMGDARIALEEVESGTVPSGATPRRSQRWKVWAASGLAAISIAVLAGLVAWNLKPSPAPAPTLLSYRITLPTGQRLAGLMTGKPMVAISPDEKHVAYVATTQGEDARQIYLWSLEQGVAQPVPGTVSATTPFFSPDGQWLVFHDGRNKLMKIPVKGKVAEIFANILNPQGATWRDHRIVVASFASALRELSGSGDTSQPLTRLDSGETMHLWPELLPDEKAVLFNVASDKSAIAIQNLGTNEHRTLIQGADKVMPRYSPSEHLIYAQAGTLMAVPFDPKRLLVGEGAVPTPVISGVQQVGGVAQFSVSSAGSLAYVPGQYLSYRYSFVKVSRNGTELKTFGAAPRFFYQPRLSPDGRRVAVEIYDDGTPQVWLYDLARDQLAPFTYKNEADNRHAVWLDSKRIVYQSGREGLRQLFVQPADGGGSERLTHLPPAPSGDVDIYTVPGSACHDELTFVRLAPTSELWVVHTSNSSGQGHEPERLELPMSADGAPQLSPDCRWLAYVSDESGRREIWVRAFPTLDNKHQISTDGGNEPQWNPDAAKHELFYRSGADMIAVDINDQGFADKKAQRLFAGPYATALGGYARPNYDVFPDGSFLMLKPVEQEQPLTQIIVVLGWSAELKRLVPAGTR